MKHSHYHKDVSAYKSIDIYRLLMLFEQNDPAMQHIVKKALVAGKRGSKDFRKDVQEIADTAVRRLAMLDEDQEATGLVLPGDHPQHVYEDVQSPKIGCGCATCRPVTMGDMRMVLCQMCGNKRCPHASNHRNACTNSNEPGQPGSSYAKASDLMRQMGGPAESQSANSRSACESTACDPTPSNPGELDAAKVAEPDADGWIEHHGGPCPVDEDTLVVVRLRNGAINEEARASRWYWSHVRGHSDADIVAFRLVKEEPQWPMVSEPGDHSKIKAAYKPGMEWTSALSCDGFSNLWTSAKIGMWDESYRYAIRPAQGAQA